VPKTGRMLTHAVWEALLGHVYAILLAIMLDYLNFLLSLGGRLD
jgi:hypothetical protein